MASSVGSNFCFGSTQRFMALILRRLGPLRRFGPRLYSSSRDKRRMELELERARNGPGLDKRLETSYYRGKARFDREEKRAKEVYAQHMEAYESKTPPEKDAVWLKDEESHWLLKEILEAQGEKDKKVMWREEEEGFGISEAIENTDWDEMDEMADAMMSQEEKDSIFAEAYLQSSGTVAIIGTPNAGKSSLMNALVKDHVSSVSPKINTTATGTLGILTEEYGQVVFVDTPGIIPLTPSKYRNSIQVGKAWEAVQTSNAAMVIIDAAKRPSQLDYFMLKQLGKMDRNPDSKLILVLNKVDRIRQKHRLLPISEELNRQVKFDATFMISATEDDGVDDIRKYLLQYCTTDSPWAFKDGQTCDMPLQERINEAIRECVFKRMNQEIPYSVTHKNNSWNVDPDTRVLHIDNVLFVENSRIQGMLIGKRGEVIDSIREKAVKTIKEITNAPVKLKLSVLVKKHWGEDKIEFPEEFGKITNA